jgi:hypothetical protein
MLSHCPGDHGKYSPVRTNSSCTYLGCLAALEFLGNAETNRVDLASGPAAQEARVSAGSDAHSISCTCLGPLGSAASNKVDPDFSHTSPRSLGKYCYLCIH